MNGISKILPIVLYILLGISALLGILFYTESIGSEMLITWCYILMGIATAAAIIFPIIGMIRDPKAAKGALIGVGSLAVVFVIAYLLAGDEVTAKYIKFGVDSTASKMVSTGLITFYILALVAIVATVSSGFVKFFK